MTLSDKQAEFLLDVAKLIQWATQEGYTVTAGELYRTLEQQQIYVNSGRSKTMKSQHMKRLAIDLNFFVNGKLTWDKDTLAPVGAYWESLNPKNRWGGNFKSLIDVPHMERLE